MNTVSLILLSLAALIAVCTFITFRLIKKLRVQEKQHKVEMKVLEHRMTRELRKCS